MIRPSNVHFLLLHSLVLALGCGSESDAAGTRQQSIGSVSSAESSCENFGLVASAEVDLGQQFTANAAQRASSQSAWLPISANGEYAWDGESFSIAANGASAQLTCAWSGEHTLEVTRLSDGCRATTQIRCNPPLCGSFGGACPGVVTEGTSVPRTNVLVRIGGSGGSVPGQSGTESECPSNIGHWVGRPLLRVHDEAGANSLFCSYAWVAPPNVLPNLSALAQTLGDDIQWDDPKVAAHGAYADMHAKLVEQSRAQLGTVSWLPGVLPHPVRVAVIDTAANLWSDPDNNPHGKAVGLLAYDTACKDSPNCAVNVENYLALPLYRDTEASPAVVRRDVLHGGAFGSHGDLARAILDAVDAMDSTPNARTILNLSVAYDSAALIDALKPKPADYSNWVVLDALRYARCRGALIVAAAGNGPVPAQPDQLPGLPARWTQTRALSVNQCRARYGIAQPQASNQPAPLLYAVSALDFGAKPLLTTRGAGQSVLAAVGLSAVRQQPDGVFTRTLSGSSMATASVSGIAAALWSHAPSLTPDEVIRTLYTASDLVSATPDFRPFEPILAPNTFTNVHRITLCSAATAGYATCLQPPVPTTPVEPGTLPSLPVPSPIQIGTAPTTTLTGVSPWDFPWLWPQPEGEPGCGACGLTRTSPGLLSIIFRNSFPIGSISNMRARISLPATTALARFTNSSASASSFAVTSEDELLEFDIPMPLPDPFNVQLDSTVGATAAELTYQITVDGTPVDAAESVLIQ
ncbi:MAG: S8/S53 family peptidase [Myxococcota bacterium]